MATFDTFTADNDPYGEHDFGNVVVDRETLFWKIDLYEKGDVKHQGARSSRGRRADAQPRIAAGLLHCSVMSRWANSVRGQARRLTSAIDQRPGVHARICTRSRGRVSWTHVPLRGFDRTLI